MAERLMKEAKASRRGPEISHLLFADGSIIFGKVSKHGAALLRDTLSIYEQCSGQRVNVHKSTIFFSTNTTVAAKEKVSQILNMQFSSNPERYLGLPNFIGKGKKASFLHLKHRVKQRPDGWSTRFLSQGDKEVFLKSVIQAIPTYTMLCFLMPKSLWKGL